MHLYVNYLSLPNSIVKFIGITAAQWTLTGQCLELGTDSQGIHLDPMERYTGCHIISHIQPC